jgi:hypothetical protein
MDAWPAPYLLSPTLPHSASIQWQVLYQATMFRVVFYTAVPTILLPFTLPLSSQVPGSCSAGSQNWSGPVTGTQKAFVGTWLWEQYLTIIVPTTFILLLGAMTPESSLLS